MKTVDQFIEGWTDGEKEKLKDLIEDCRERERKLLQSKEDSKNVAHRLRVAFDEAVAGLMEIQKRMDDLILTLMITDRPKGLIN